MTTRTNSMSLLFVVLLALGGATQSLAQKPPRYLIVHSYHSQLDWVQDMSAGIKAGMEPQAQYSEFFMDTKRLPVARHKQQAAAALELYQQLRPDLVFICDDNALGLVGEKTALSTLTVFGGINGSIQRDYPWVFSSPLTAGVLERLLLKRGITEISNTLDSTDKTALILMSMSPTAQLAFSEELNSQNQLRLPGGIEVEIFRSSRWHDWQSRIRHINPENYSMILTVDNLALRDNDNLHVPASQIVQWINQNSSVPAFTTHKGQSGPGRLAGSISIDSYKIGQEMARLAKQMLETGAAPKNPAERIVEHDEISFLFSSSEVSRLRPSINQAVAKSAQWQE